jgi:hypothetical protein
MEYLLMGTVNALRFAVDASFSLREAHFRHHRQSPINEAERAFGCPVHFGCPDDRIVFPSSALWTAPRFANRSIAEEIEKFARAKGFPSAPLLVLLANEEIPVRLADPYLLGLAGRTEKSLRGMEQSFRDQAQDVLKRLSLARERAATLALDNSRGWCFRPQFSHEKACPEAKFTLEVHLKSIQF